MKGVVAAGSTLTMEAGLEALRQGGNAVDAAIAATIMAGVAEPLLSGMGGAGIATVRFKGETHFVDFFANMPGLGKPQSDPAEMDEVSINFGPTTQSFLVGNGSTAVPGMAAGIQALHERFGSLPLDVLVAPAVSAARNGVPVTAGFERVCKLLWPILERSKSVRALFSRDGQPLQEGDTFYCHELAATLEQFGAIGHKLFTDGDVAQSILAHIDGESNLTESDLRFQKAHISPALELPYRSARLWIPNAPSVAGISLAHSLCELEVSGPIGDPTSAETVQMIANALQATFKIRRKPFLRDLFTDGFGDSFMARVRARRDASPGPQPGYTTHISTADQDGNAVSITHSLGETAGETAGETGVLINNFLGEADVNPPRLRRPAGARLWTMCCPTILETEDGRVFALGSGGSSRIPTAVLHGTMYLADARWSTEDAVRGPRTHIEGDALHIETWNRTPETLRTVHEQWPDRIPFDGPNMFFGGLHVAGIGPDGFEGSGDSRRSGAFGEV